jgi:hypothetical protein
MQCLGELCLSWYTLQEGDHQYRPLEVALTIGPDLARPLHSIWNTIEAYGEQLDRLCRQQARTAFEVVASATGPALQLTIALAGPDEALRLVLEEKEIRYYLLRGDELLVVDHDEPRIDRGVYLLLAKLAGQC